MARTLVPPGRRTEEGCRAWAGAAWEGVFLPRRAPGRAQDRGLHLRRYGAHLGLGAETVHVLEVAAPMHDIGKIGIPDAILLKEGPLTRVEIDRGFAQRVAEWERRLAPWLADIEPVEPPAQVWARICLRLGWKDSEPAAAGLWQSLGFWRAATAR